MSEYNLEIHNINDINMSTWQITHTVNTLTTVNNKFDILKRLNVYINSGIKKSNIFIMDKSYLFNTNYCSYFKMLGEDKNQAQKIEIDKIYNMGKIISMECNDEIKNINILFEINRKLSSILNLHFKCRLNKKYLMDSYFTLFEKDLNGAIDCLYEGAEEQICNIFERRINPDYVNMQKIIEDCKKIATDKHILAKFYQTKGEYEQKFGYYFNSCARPIVGIYDEKRHSFLIINADHIYQNGEESSSQIKLKKITKNSPVLLAFTVVGVMGAVMGYLAYRNHNVNTVVDDCDIFDVPDDRKDALQNIIKNNENSILDVNKNENVDEKILELAIDTYGKLEGVTDSKKVKIEYEKIM